MELHLERSLAERRIFPAINVSSSGTRNEDKLLGEEKLQKVWRLRRMLEALNELERTELLIERLAKTNSNDEFLDSLHKDVS